MPWPGTARYFGREQWYFQNDNASIHRANETETGNEGLTFYLFSLTTRSPALNPFRKVGYLLKNAVRKNICRIKLSTVLYLLCALTTSWNSLPKVFIQSLAGTNHCQDDVIKF